MTFLPCDTDVLIQTFLSDSVFALRSLRSDYSVQPLIVSEVEIELRSNRSFPGRFDAELAKALKNDTLQLADESLARTLVPAPPAAAGALWGQYKLRGQRYAKRVGSGEAHTLALGVEFSLPVSSNDRKALRVLAGVPESLPSPVLRFFDLICFAYQSGSATEADCNQIRKALQQHGEGMPADFERASFGDGLRTFVPRLIDGARPLVGDSGPTGVVVGPESKMVIRRLP